MIGMEPWEREHWVFPWPADVVVVGEERAKVEVALAEVNRHVRACRNCRIEAGAGAGGPVFSFAFCPPGSAAVDAIDVACARKAVAP